MRAALMNSLADISNALSEDVSHLECGEWVTIPLDERRELRLLRVADQSGVRAVLAQRPLPRTGPEEEQVLVALLRVAADARFTDGFSGGIDENGWDCISVVLDVLADPAHVETTLRRAMERLSEISSPVGFASFPRQTWGLA